MKNYSYIIFFLTLLFSFVTGAVKMSGQQEKLEILFSEEVRYDKIGQQEVSIYWGDVQVKKGKTYMYMDSVRQIERDLWAYGNIVIQEGDSITLFGDSMFFDDRKNMLFLYGDVAMQKAEEALFTNYLEYNINSKVGYYTGGGTLTSSETYLSSKTGTYYTRTEDMLFQDSVFAENPEFDLKSNSLWFNQKTSIITFNGPTLIRFENSKSTIYCEGGYYDIPQKKALFLRNAQYSGEKSLASGDSILYLQDQGKIEISGNAYYREDSLQAKAEKMIYFESLELVQLIKKADFRNTDMNATGDFLEYFTRTRTFKTNQRSTILQDNKFITADNFDVSNITGKGYITGNIFFHDTINKVVMWSDSAYIERRNDYVKSFGDRPLLLNYSGGDTLWICADTLISFTGDHRGAGSAAIADDVDAPVMSPDSLHRMPFNENTADLPAGQDSVHSQHRFEAQDSVIADVRQADALLDTLPVERERFSDRRGIPAPEPDGFSKEKHVELDAAASVYADSLINGSVDSIYFIPENASSGIVVQDSTILNSSESDTAIQRTPRVILGIGDVRIYKEGMQGVCDSLTYLEIDSTFYLDGTPVLWSDSTQISGDSIHLILVNDKIDRLLSINNAFIVSTIDGYFFSQIAGKRAEGFFEGTGMKEMLVRGAVRTVYYIINDENEYVGVNRQDASRLKILFEEGKADDIYFYEKPEGEMLPMRGTDHEGLKLEGFFFAIDRRPASPADLRPGLTGEIRDFITFGYLEKLAKEESNPDEESGQEEAPAVDEVDETGDMPSVSGDE